MLANRNARLDFSKADTGKMIDRWVQIRMSDKQRVALRETRDNLTKIAEWARSIEQRGGRVIFLRMIVTGKVRDIENQLYPRAKYWDVFVRSQTSPSIDVADIPSFTKYQCPEGSHLDYRDVAGFSSDFARLLKTMKVF